MKGVVEFLVSGNMCIEERSNVVIWFFSSLSSSFLSFFFFQEQICEIEREGEGKKLEKRNESSRHAPLFPRMYKSQYEGGREIPRAGN